MPRILVVDDNPEILIVVEASLAASGFDVVCTLSPDEALQLLAAQPFDAAVLDVMMPRMSGYELLSRLRKLPGGARLPVLFLSALSDAEARIQGLRLGADDYLGKPFVADELVLRVERLVRARAPVASGLQGSLESFPLSSLVQRLGEDDQSGELEIRAAGIAGSMTFQRGKLVEVRAGALRGQEAALALVDASQGHFHFNPRQADSPGEARRAIDWQSILLSAAWTHDELDRRRSHLPSPGQALRSVGKAPRSPDELQGLPIGEVSRLLGELEAPTREHIEAAASAAPKRVQLALAWLIEQGAVVAEAGEDPVPLETPDQAFLAYVEAWTGRAPDGRYPTLVIAYDPSTWGQLRDLLAGVPTGLLADPASTQPLLATGKGSMSLRHGQAALIAQVQPLGSGTALVEIDLGQRCDVVLWLGEESRHLPPRSLLAQVRDSPEPGQGLLVPATSSLRRALSSPSRASHRWGDFWRVAETPPESFAELLRLLIPDRAA